MNSKNSNEDRNEIHYFLSREELLKLAKESSGISENKPVNPILPEELQKIVYELHLHQLELEMQNDELRWAQIELEKSRERYFDLYELAPVGYFTLSNKGIVLEANLTLSVMLNEFAIRLVKQPFSFFVDPEDRMLFYKNLKRVIKTGNAEVWELRMIKKENDIAFWGRIDVTRASEDDAVFCRCIITDITDMKLVEIELQRKNEELHLFLNSNLILEN